MVAMAGEHEGTVTVPVREYIPGPRADLNRALGGIKAAAQETG